MFDGAHGFPPAPRPYRPASINTRAMLPALRAQGSQTTVEGLAYVLGVNAIAAARWRAVTWPGEDLADHNHPARAEALDPETPQGRLGEALALLADAVTRHQALTGCDGLEIARATLVDHFNEEFADHVLAPLEVNRMDIAINAMIASPEPGDPPPPSPRQPTPGERRDAAGAVLGLAWADPRLDGLADALAAFHVAHQADGVDAQGTATVAERASVGAALQDAADQGVTQGELQITVNAWALVTGSPGIVVNDAAAI